MSHSATVEPEIQYASLEQQGETAQIGIWVFLINETLFFGTLIFAYAFYRLSYPHQFALAAKEAVLWCGSVNLVLLLTSSVSMVLAINAAAQGRRREMIGWLLVTLMLGLTFLGVKGFEYFEDVKDRVVPVVDFAMQRDAMPAGELFWFFYWVATGLHAIHLSVGLGLIVYLLWRIRRGEITPAYYAPIEVIGIYWSFVDAVWLFLYPCIYLVGRS